MKLVAVIGSNRNESRSLKVANTIINKALAKGCDVKIYDINSINLKGCQGCGTCRKNSIDCILDDGLKDYWQDLHSCDVLLITGANYYSMPCGQMITYMNRHYCLTDNNKTNRLKSGKKLISVFSQGAPQVYPKYDPHYEWYIGTFLSKGMELMSQITIGGDSDLSANSEIMKLAVELGNSME